MCSRRIGDASAIRQSTSMVLLVLVAVLLAGGLSLQLVLSAGAQQAAGASAAQGAVSSGGRFGFGQPANAAQIAAENIDVRPDGTGLPPGSGMAAAGHAIYNVKCAACHGDTGREGGSGPILVDA